MILTAWSFAGVVGGLVFTAVYNEQKTLLAASMGAQKALLYVYNVNFQWILAFAILGFFLCVVIPTRLRDRMLPKVDGEWFRFRFIDNRLIRVVRGRFVVVPEQQVQKEWGGYVSTVLSSPAASVSVSPVIVVQQ